LGFDEFGFGDFTKYPAQTKTGDIIELLKKTHSQSFVPISKTQINSTKWKKLAQG